MAEKIPTPYRVRQQTSGYTGVTSYIVVKNPGGRRVSVHAHVTRESAQIAADGLNKSEAEHQANLADPEWVAARDAKRAEWEAAEQARSDAFARIIAAQARKAEQA